MAPETGRKPLPEAEPVALNELYLDPRNPRLAALHIRVDDQTGILKVLWKEMSVNELVDSVAVDRLLATRGDFFQPGRRPPHRDRG